ncbi:DUF4142 domain-containing protein [Streptomyces antibioticus]
MTTGAIGYPLVLAVQKTSSSPSRVVANTSFGPLTEGDRDFVVQVRAAGLWEEPAGRLALRKGTSRAVRTAGQTLVDGNVRLDTACRGVASRLGIALPNAPSPQQQGFMTTLDIDSGGKFDKDLANILRVADGQLFPLIADTRTTTRNTLVRRLADQANNTVLERMDALEETGLVDFDQVLLQETTPPKLPGSMVTPPAPRPGEPTASLSGPPAPDSLGPAPTAPPTIK